MGRYYDTHYGYCWSPQYNTWSNPCLGAVNFIGFFENIIDFLSSAQERSKITSQFTNPNQFNALYKLGRNVDPKFALEFTDEYQVEALERLDHKIAVKVKYPLDEVKILAISADVDHEIVAQITDLIQYQAMIQHVDHKLALNFTDGCQILALRRGADAKLALEFGWNKLREQCRYLEYHMPPKLAVKFSNWNTVKAGNILFGGIYMTEFVKHPDLHMVVQITDNFQIYAMELGVKIQIAIGWNPVINFNHLNSCQKATLNDYYKYHCISTEAINDISDYDCNHFDFEVIPCGYNTNPYPDANQIIF